GTRPPEATLGSLACGEPGNRLQKINKTRRRSTRRLLADSGLCGAHVLRELQGVTDLAPEGRWCWATQAADALRELNQLVEDALAGGTELGGANLDGIDPAALAAAVHRYRSAALLGVAATGARTSKLMGKHNALAHRLINRQDDYLRFTRDPRVPFDNYADVPVMPRSA
ncbi:MAG: transposase, partial [Actinobacteria bacterium]|nr:transposase [Actinomycetota bacterium]